jgi:hypothetical protein
MQPAQPATYAAACDWVVTLLRTDPDVEVLCFAHLYPNGKGQFVQGERRENGRFTYTRHMDTKKKLNSYNRAFRDDYYWAAWAY